MSIGDSTLKPGDQVTVSARGTFVFTVNDIDEDTGTAMIEVNADSPLTYPWPARVSDLYPPRTDSESPSSCRSLSLHLFGTDPCFRYGDRCNHPSSPTGE
ncbi:hypothetical protein [Rhodococcus pyridinivorans]|uniref:hypothetical protein n=1 Tax=Rhodococcus pyridinivorans TaxID=103816 RepID=UPI003AB06E71